MRVRLLTILALATLPLSGLPTVGVGLSREVVAMGAAEPDGCCCCGDTQSDFCSMAEMEETPCTCNEAPTEPNRAPKAPAPRDNTQVLLALMKTDPGIVVDVPEPVIPVLRGDSTLLRGATHNETQALLCIWRT